MTAATIRFLAFSTTLALLPACSSSDYMRVDGVTRGAGDAIAANTVMQIVDPWQRGVEDTDLLVPAERPARPDGAGASGAASGTAGAND